MRIKLSATFGVVALLVVAACGGGSSDTDDTADKAKSGTYADHDALVTAAEKEGSVKVLTSMTEDAIPGITEAWKKKYPNIELEINEQTGDDDKRILLEIQAGQSDVDNLHLSAESYADYLPELEDFDLLALIKDGVLDIPEEMVNPAHKNTMAAGSGIGAFSYNPKLLSDADAPKTYDDLLLPKFKDRKFLIDIEPANLASLGAAWGEDKLKEYAKALAGQKPIWARGDTVSLTAMAAGEYKLHSFSNYHSAFRVSLKSPDNIKIVLLEPIPVRLTQIESIRKGAKHPAAALLFLEHTASQEVQDILDEFEPRQSSVYAEGSELNTLTAGKELSVMSWEEFPKLDDWESMIVKEWGFPQAQVMVD
jgi:iron(III) transport system substrate-binding protein